MHTYRQATDDDWVVGYFDSVKNDWVGLKQFGTEAEAQALVNYLNGGAGKPYVAQRPIRRRVR
jgi:hypothetical protein